MNAAVITSPSTSFIAPAALSLLQLVTTKRMYKRMVEPMDKRIDKHMDEPMDKQTKEQTR